MGGREGRRDRGEEEEVRRREEVKGREEERNREEPQTHAAGY